MKHKAHKECRIGQGIRNNAELCVDPGTADGEKYAPPVKRQYRRNLLCKSHFEKYRREKSARQSFNDKVTAGVGGVTITASAPEHQIADDRKIVIPVDICSADCAMAGGCDHRFAPGDPPDADI